MNQFIWLALILIGYFNLWFIISLIKKRNDVADLAWGVGFMLMVWSARLLWPVVTTRALIANVLITVWGLRLAGHISNSFCIRSAIAGKEIPTPS